MTDAVPSRGELILYATDDGQAKFSLRAEGGTVWLTQIELADLFQSTKQNISLHIKNILDEGELGEAATVKESLTVQTEGTREIRRSVKLYNLDLSRRFYRMLDMHMPRWQQRKSRLDNLAEALFNF